jgi:hypothetical protein
MYDSIRNKNKDRAKMQFPSSFFLVLPSSSLRLCLPFRLHPDRPGWEMQTQLREDGRNVYANLSVSTTNSCHKDVENSIKNVAMLSANGKGKRKMFRNDLCGIENV